MKLAWKKGVVIACALSVSGCASIVGGRYQQIQVETRAADQSIRADCTLSNGESQVRVTTPGNGFVASLGVEGGGVVDALSNFFGWSKNPNSETQAAPSSGPSSSQAPGKENLYQGH